MSEKWTWVCRLAGLVCLVGTSASAQQGPLGEGDSGAAPPPPASPIPCRPPCGADDTCVNGRCVREGSEGGSETERTETPENRYSATSESGFTVGLRVGYALPLGESASGVTLSDDYSSLVPFVLDLGYHFTPHIYFGFLGDLGILALADGACATPADCSGFVTRVGLNLHYRFNPRGVVDPWIGVGFGFELLSQTVSAGGVDQEYTASGLELGNGQLGLDFMLTPALRVGPYGRLSAGQYSSFRTGGGEAEDIEDTALHSWFELGMRVAFDP